MGTPKRLSCCRRVCNSSWRKGPLLRLRTEQTEEASAEDASQATVSFDADSMPMLSVDQAQRDSEVAAISENAYFQDVQRLAESIRSRRRSQNNGRENDH